jgi:S-adenosylmethionine hydrolase
LSDFGHRDHYVGVMRAVLLGICPKARLIDLTHGVPPQNILSGAYLLAASVRFLPHGAIVVGVVDPGVGTDRRAIAVATETNVFVGPDNGLFALTLRDRPGVTAFELTDTQYHLGEAASTFDGRDIFAPVAACLANGVPLEQLGPAIAVDSLVRLDRAPETVSKGRMACHVIHVDRFGNLITDLRREDLVDEQQLTGALVGELDCPFGETFADVEPGSALVYWGSSDHLEIAVRDGNAAEMSGFGQGATVMVCVRASDPS